MMAQPSGSERTDPGAPFGTEPRRSSGVLVVLGVLYAAWFVFLLWMAAFHTGQ
jgi:hypothetical protein